MKRRGFVLWFNLRRANAELAYYNGGPVCFFSFGWLHNEGVELEPNERERCVWCDEAIGLGITDECVCNEDVEAQGDR